MIARVGRTQKGPDERLFSATSRRSRCEPTTPAVAPDPINPTVELPVHQRLSLRGRELAKTRHPLSRAFNEPRRLAGTGRRSRAEPESRLSVLTVEGGTIS
jgi:hypothetical protein